MALPLTFRDSFKFRPDPLFDCWLRRPKYTRDDLLQVKLTDLHIVCDAIGYCLNRGPVWSPVWYVNSSRGTGIVYELAQDQGSHVLAIL
jgi:hypothetical protein